MKKPTRKLVVRRETLRVLAAMDLTHAVGGDGGDGAVIAETGKAMCTAIAVLPATNA
jgi:hypothetical protein